MNMPGITIVGAGSYVPGEPVTNEALSRVMETSDDWIYQRTGIRQRYYAPDGVGCSDLAKIAAERALDSARLSPKDVDYIIFATMTPDYLFPGSGGLLGAKLGIPGVPALDIRQQCAAIPFGLQVANGLVQSGAANTVLLIGAEVHAAFMPWSDWRPLYDANIQVDPIEKARATEHRGVAILFGDGAGALVLRRSETPNGGLLRTLVHTDGRLFEQIYIRPGGFRRRPYWASQDEVQSGEVVPKMAGRDLFKNAVTKLPQAIRDVCKQEGINPTTDIDWVIAHQANQRINQAVTEALGIDPEKVPSNVERYGNTSGATIPILMDELIREKRIKRGDMLCFVALGAGLSWGASLMRY